MIPADVKANKTKRKKRSGGCTAVSYNFLQEPPSKLEVQFKKGMYF